MRYVSHDQTIQNPSGKDVLVHIFSIENIFSPHKKFYGITANVVYPKTMLFLLFLCTTRQHWVWRPNHRTSSRPVPTEILVGIQKMILMMKIRRSMSNPERSCVLSPKNSLLAFWVNFFKKYFLWNVQNLHYFENSAILPKEKVRAHKICDFWKIQNNFQFA